MCHPFRQRANKRTVHIWSRANIPLLKEELKTACAQFCTKYEEGNFPIDIMWDDFKSIVNNIMTKIPTKNLSQRFNQPWINRKCKRLSRRKRRLYKRAQRTRLTSDWTKFRQVVNECKKQCRKARDKYINENILDSTDTKCFYKYIKHKQKDNITVAPLKKNGNIIIDDQKKANILNEQYCNVFSKPNKDVPPIRSPIVENCMADIVINEGGVRSLLTKLNPQKASGPDNISARILKECAEVIADALVLLFNAAMKQPSDSKHGSITPIYKCGNKSRSKAESYRSVSLTAITLKSWNISCLVTL